MYLAALKALRGEITAARHAPRRAVDRGNILYVPAVADPEGPAWDTPPEARPSESPG